MLLWIQPREGPLPHPHAAGVRDEHGNRAVRSAIDCRAGGFTPPAPIAANRQRGTGTQLRSAGSATACTTPTPERRGPVGEPGVPPRLSGCPDLNWGPLRPERSALPGCATPRAGTG